MSREFTKRLLESVDEGLFDPKTLLRSELNWMEEHEVAEFCDHNMLFDDDDDDDDDELCDRFMRVVSEISHTEDGQTVCPDCAGE